MLRLYSNWFILLVSFLLLNNYAFGQLTIQIKGHVSQKITGQPIPSVSATLYRLKPDTTLIAFASTDIAGNYSIKTSSLSDSYKLSIRGLGFETIDTLITPEKNALSIQLNFSLTTKAIELKEVSVKAIIPVRSENDTTTYAVKAFANGTERSVEDLLKKLPGIQVSEDGKIKVNGKIVDKVLIEGEDLFSKKYQLITRNMGADVLEKVQAINNYSENSLLQGIEKSGRLVLNLKIKDDIKAKVFGNGGIAAGTAKRYEVNLSVFSLIKRLKIGVIGNANNIGTDPIVNAQYELESDQQNVSSTESVSTNPLVNNQLTTVPDLAVDRYNFNRVNLVGATVSSKLTGNLKIRGFYYFSNDKQHSQANNRFSYLLDNKTINVYDSLDNVRAPIVWAGNIRMDYKVDAKTLITFSSDIKRTSASLKFNTISKNEVLSEEISNEGFEKSLLSNQHLSITRRLPGKNALLVDLNYIYNQLPQQNIYNSARYNSFFGVPPDYNLYNQAIARSSAEMSAGLRWKGSSDTRKYSIGSSLVVRNETASISAQLQTPDQRQIVPVVSDKNLTRYESVYFTTEGHYFQKWDRWDLSTDVALQHVRASGYDSTDVLTSKKLWLNPSLTVGYDLGKRQKMRFTYSRNNTLPIINNLISNSILTDYRTFSRFIPALPVITSNRLSLSYQYVNWPGLLSFFTTASWASNKPPYSTHLQISNTINQQTTRPIEGTLGQWFVFGQLDKLIAPISLKVRWEGEASRGEQFNQINSTDLRRSQFTSINNTLYFITSFDHPFNAELGFRRSDFTVSTVQPEGLPAYQTRLIKPHAVFTLRPSGGWFFKLSAEWYDWRFKTSTNAAQFVDALVRYEPSQSKWTFGLVGSNLFNNQYLVFNQVSNYFVSQQAYTLLPRFIMIRVERKI
ncbi:carboxypeptidase-like regulatory domain-containing protein [Spirosoma pulveris]